MLSDIARIVTRSPRRLVEDILGCAALIGLGLAVFWVPPLL